MSERVTPLLERIGSAVGATSDVVSDLVRSVPQLLERRDRDAKRQQQERLRSIISRIRTTPVREIEDELGIDRYKYPRGHRGYSIHPRNHRPTSRSEERDQYEESERKLAELVKRYEREESPSSDPDPKQAR